MQADLNGGTHALGSSYVLEGQLDYSCLVLFFKGTHELTPYRSSVTGEVRS